MGRLDHCVLKGVLRKAVFPLNGVFVNRIITRMTGYEPNEITIFLRDNPDKSLGESLTKACYVTILV